MKILLLLVIGLLAIVFGPLLSIWGLNTLFPVLAIPYTWSTWAAVIVVSSLVSGRNYVSMNKE